MRFYGVDIGYGFTKVAAAGRPPLVMPSIVGSNEELSYRSDIGDRIRIIPLSLKGHSYLVGEAARRFSRHRYRIFDSTWAESPYYLLLFASALMRIDKSAAEPLAVVTGLPVSHYNQERVRQVQDLLGQAHKVQISSEEALRHKSVRIFGESVDLSDLIAERIREVAELILSYAHSLWGRGERLNRLILAGGGTNIFRSYFSTYPNLHVPEEPSLSNVRGYLKLARKTRW